MTCSNFVKSTLPAAVLGFLALGLASMPASAATTQTATFLVQAQVQNSCTISGAPINFDPYTGAALNAQGMLTVNCNSVPATYSIGLDAGQASGATTSDRKMTNGTDTLSYKLCSDASCSTNWGSLSDPGSFVTVTDKSTSKPIYAQIPAKQTSPMGSYTDTITATISY